MKSNGLLHKIALVLLALSPCALHAAANQTPQEFAPGILSTGHEFTIAFMPDGHEACFTRFAPGKQLHIFCSRSIAGVWQPAQLISFSSDAWSDLDPFFTADGKRMYFVSTQPHAVQSATSTKRNMDLWVADRKGDDWATPRPIENVNSDAKEGSPSVTADGTLYLFSDRTRPPDSNSIYAARLVDGKYAAPVLLPAPLNSPSSDTSPFVTADGNLMLFYSDRPGGLGKGDLYAAVRKHGVWQAPVNLGSTVNTADDEYNPELSPDGKQLFFGRDGKIYSVPVAAVPSLRKLAPQRHTGTK